MAITLPAIWLGCDLLLRSKPSARAASQCEMAHVGTGLGGYFNQLFNTNLRWQFWAIGFAALLLFFAIGKMRTTPLKWRSAGRISMPRWLRPNRVECSETRNR